METFGKINLIHGDCMDYLRSLPDNAFSLAVVDPPFGAGNQPDGGGYDSMAATDGTDTASVRRTGGTWASKYKRVESLRRLVRPLQEGITPPHEETEKGEAIDLRNYRGRFKKYEREDSGERKSETGIDWDVAPEPEYFEQLFRVSKNQIIWGANYFPNMPPTRCFLVWRKLSISEKFSMAMAEYAWTSFNQNAKVFECAPQGKKNDPRFHPTAKPIELYAWIFNNFCKAGDTILDTHLGSGSSAIAAHQLGFDFTGIEIDDEYYEKAKERLLRYQAQLSLF
jgi:site-specific DNA-methyltransferase (adenine-specific)